MYLLCNNGKGRAMEEKTITVETGDCTVVLRFAPDNTKDSKAAVLSLLRQNFLQRVIKEDKEK